MLVELPLSNNSQSSLKVVKLFLSANYFPMKENLSTMKCGGWGTNQKL